MPIPRVATFTACLLIAGALPARPAFAADASVGDSGTNPEASTGVLPDGSTAPDAAPTNVPEASTAADTGAVSPKFVVGASCEKDADCAGGLVCARAGGEEFAGSGPAGGLCTVDCSQHGQADCDAVDVGSACVPFDADGKIAFCFERCAEGNPIPGITKCHARPDMACSPSPAATDGSGAGFFCKPTCRGDYDCGDRKCDGLTGFCAATSGGGDSPIGSACEPAADTRACQGACVAFPGGSGDKDSSACSAYCSFGAVNSCGVGPTSTGPVQAACVPFYVNESIGDIGFCVQLCDCDDDCHNTAYVCQPLAASVAGASSRAGACVPRSQASDEHLSCSGADAAPTSPGTETEAGTSSSKDAGADAAPSGGHGSDSGCGCRIEASQSTGTRKGMLVLALATVLVARRRRANG